MLSSRSSKSFMLWMLLGLSPSLVAQQHFSPINSTCPTEVILGNGTCGGAPGGEGAGLPAGSIMFILSGSCPTGYAEEASLAGRFLVGTTAGAGDVGGTGGSDTITPAGSNSGGAVSAHAGTAVADHASHTHTYTDVIAHTHTIPVGATDDTAAPFDRADAGTNASGANATTATGSTGVATGTTAGPSATLTHSVTQPSNHTFTQPSFSGTQFDNRPAFIRLIPCRKT